MDYYDLMMIFNRCTALALMVSLNVYAQSPAPTTPPKALPAPAIPGSSAAGTSPPSVAKAQGNSVLDGELLYQLLLGELSTQIGDQAAGYSLLLDAARKTNDARLFQRAVEIALQARSGESALGAARAWRTAMPNSREANRYQLQILIGLNKTNELTDPIKREIALAEPGDRAQVISSIPRYFVRSTDKKQAASVVEQSLVDHLTSPQNGVAAWTTIGRMRIEAGDPAGALDAARRGHALNATAEGPALLALALMGPTLPAAEVIVRKYLEGKPEAEVRMEYARALLNAQRFAEASSQIQSVTTDKPDLADAWLIQGTLELQDNKLSAAEKSLLRYLDVMAAQPSSARNPQQNRGLIQAYLSLSQIAEQRKDFKLAESWLNKISSSEDMIRAQSRRASLLAIQGKLEDGIELIRALPERSVGDARLKIQAEVQLLRDNKKFQTAFDLLAKATTQNPTDYDFLYDQATLAEKLGNPDEMETLLRRIIAGKPDFHHAYNALGYSFAERNIRLPEARQLIIKALEFAPNDPFITDSLGWVEFRMGNKAEALRILQGAYKSRPDPEIAAHLGEVLWSMGKRDEARKIWKEGVALAADNETLVETLKRFRVKP
jgi:tetratricopeptide (TPR) repeat protein